MTPEEQAEQFQRFRESFASENALEDFSTKLIEVMKPLEQWGLLEELPKEHDGNLEKIFVRTREKEGFSAEAGRDVPDVLIKNVSARLQQSLNEQLPSVELAQQVFAWLRPRLVPTLKLNPNATDEAQDEAEAQVADVNKQFHAGEDTLVKGGESIGVEKLGLMKLEYAKQIEERGFSARFRRILAMLGMYAAIFTLCGFYIHSREPQAITELPNFIGLLALFAITIVASWLVSHYLWGTEIIPLLLLGMTLRLLTSKKWPSCWLPV